MADVCHTPGSPNLMEGEERGAAFKGAVAADEPRRVRARIRSGEHTAPTSGLCSGFQQANLVILPKAFASDFEEFCRRNSQPCPLLAVLAPGQSEAATIAPGSDVRTDVPRYRVWRHGKLVEEVTDVTSVFRDDMVSFFLGCSFGFERSLSENGIEVRNITEGKNVSMYKTNRQCETVGPFQSPLVVSMRPIHKDKIAKAIEITGNFPAAHGPPIHSGDAATIGIADINKVDFGDAVTIREDEVPVFWACGVTSTLAALSAGADLVITHSPGHMFITDLPDTAAPPHTSTK